LILKIERTRRSNLPTYYGISSIFFLQEFDLLFIPMLLQEMIAVRNYERNLSTLNKLNYTLRSLRRNLTAFQDTTAATNNSTLSHYFIKDAFKTSDRNIRLCTIDKKKNFTKKLNDKQNLYGK
jgi:hypothetical protein